MGVRWFEDGSLNLPYGFLRVGAAVPVVRVGDCRGNVERIAGLMERAEADGVRVLAFPELCITGYTCGDLFHQTVLQRAAMEGLLDLARRTKSAFTGLAIVGLPVVSDDLLYNCAAVLHRGKVLGVVPKAYLPNYKEFYERRWFAAGAGVRGRQLTLDEERIPFGVDQLFAASDVEGLVVGVEVCEDLWVPVSPSCHQALRGATVLINLSASNDLIGKASYRRLLVLNQSGRCISGYIYVSCGVHESTTDVVFGGHCLIAENATLLAESRRFDRGDSLLIADLDLDRLRNERAKLNSFGDNQQQLGGNQVFNRQSFTLQTGEFGFQVRTANQEPIRLMRTIEAHPFVPPETGQLRERCDEIFHIQVAGLAKRLEVLNVPPVVIGVSGGLDSTLALLVACKTMDLLGAGREKIRGYTMPGFGTTTRTKANAHAVMQQLGVTALEVDIREMCLLEWKALRHRPFGIDLDGLGVETLTAKLQALPPEKKRQDLVFENVQARMRMSVLMNAGFVVGTGDLSELALGWTTYNADHMSMYNPNVSIPKTLVKFLVQWAAENEFEGEARRVLLDVVATRISPELLPSDLEGLHVQSTEDVLGPYELHDFFLFHFLRYGAPPEKILFLAEHASFDRPYTRDEIRRWLKVFIQRFFANQFKRSCLPDGPKVGTISLSPRGDWRMPSDAEAAEWLTD